MKWIVLLLLLMGASGCASSGKPVDCGWRLKPINPPAVKAPISEDPNQ